MYWQVEELKNMEYPDNVVSTARVELNFAEENTGGKKWHKVCVNATVTVKKPGGGTLGGETVIILRLNVSCGDRFDKLLGKSSQEISLPKLENEPDYLKGYNDIVEYLSKLSADQLRKLPVKVFKKDIGVSLDPDASYLPFSNDAPRESVLLISAVASLWVYKKIKRLDVLMLSFRELLSEYRKSGLAIALNQTHEYAMNYRYSLSVDIPSLPLALKLYKGREVDSGAIKGLLEAVKKPYSFKEELEVLKEWINGYAGIINRYPRETYQSV